MGRNLAIITARSGSKGYRDKNIAMLAGKPLMAYSIEAALESGCFDAVMVSTDSARYAEIAEAHGAEVPFLRSEKTSGDTASSWDVVREVLEEYEKRGSTFETFMLLQPTSPLRTAADIQNAYTLMEQRKANAVVSVCEADHPPTDYNTLPEDGVFDNFFQKGTESIRRQDAGTYYRVNGAIYLADVGAFYREDSIYDVGCYAYRMEHACSVDIDEEIDFRFAEFLIERYGKER